MSGPTWLSPKHLSPAEQTATSVSVSTPAVFKPQKKFATIPVPKSESGSFEQNGGLGQPPPYQTSPSGGFVTPSHIEGPGSHSSSSGRFRPLSPEAAEQYYPSTPAAKDERGVAAWGTGPPSYQMQGISLDTGSYRPSSLDAEIDSLTNMLADLESSGPQRHAETQGYDGMVHSAGALSAAHVSKQSSGYKPAALSQPKQAAYGAAPQVGMYGAERKPPGYGASPQSSTYMVASATGAVYNPPLPESHGASQSGGYGVSQSLSQGTKPYPQPMPASYTTASSSTGPAFNVQVKVAQPVLNYSEPRRKAEQAYGPPSPRHLGPSYSAQHATEPSFRAQQTAEPSYRAPAAMEQSYRGPQTTEPSYRGPQTTEPSYRGSQTTEPSYRGPQTTEQSYRGPQASEQTYRWPQVIEQSYRGAQTPEPSYRGPPAIEHSCRGPPTEPSHRGPQVIEQSYRRSQVTEPSYRGPQTIEPSYRGPQTIEPSYRGPQAIEPSYRGPQAIETSYRGPQTTETSYRGPQTTEPSYRSPQHTTESSYRGSQTRPLQSTEPSYRGSPSAEPPYRAPQHTTDASYRAQQGRYPEPQMAPGQNWYQTSAYLTGTDPGYSEAEVPQDRGYGQQNAKMAEMEQYSTVTKASGPQHQSAVGRGSRDQSIPPPGGSAGYHQQGSSSRPEEELDRLTKKLVHDMNNPPAGEYFGRCARCGENVVGDGTGCVAMDQVFHEDCFTCISCHCRLRGQPFYAIEKKSYCEACYIVTLEKCTMCLKPILDRILRAMGQAYHPQCFLCVVCRRCLDGVPFTVDATSQIHCIEDFHRKFAPRCSVCGDAIMPEPGQEETVRIVALDRSFHINCYKCEECGLLLSSEGEGRGCYPLDGHILCKSCSARRIQELSSKITTDC